MPTSMTVVLILAVNPKSIVYQCIQISLINIGGVLSPEPKDLQYSIMSDGSKLHNLIGLAINFIMD